MSYNFGNPLNNQHQSYLGGASDPTEFFDVDISPWDPFFQDTEGSGINFFEDDIYFDVYNGEIIDTSVFRERIEADFDANRDFQGKENLSFMSMGADPYLDVALPLQQRGVVDSDFLEDISYLQDNYFAMREDVRQLDEERAAGSILGKLVQGAKARQKARGKPGRSRPKTPGRTTPPSGLGIRQQRASQADAVRTQASKNALRTLVAGGYKLNKVPSRSAEDVARRFQIAQKITPRAERLRINPVRTRA